LMEYTIRKGIKSMIKMICKIILAILLVGLSYFFGKVWRQNVRVINPQEDKNLPIYCVDTQEKKTALTFDVAWGNEDMGEILAILKENKVKATFFLTGEWVSKYPEEVKKMVREGHEIGNHGNHHKYMTQLSPEEQKREILDLHEKVKAVTGLEMDLFRPPYGDYDEKVVITAKECGYQSVQWSVDSLDWKEYGKEAMIAQTVDHKELKNGAILLLHTGTLYTKEALPEIIKGIREKGYQCVPVSKLIYKRQFYIDPSGKQFRREDK
jgi:polysaccharide deacetylase family sporulation protein PdaB